MLRERQPLLAVRPEAPGPEVAPKPEPELTVMNERALLRKPESTTLGLRARTAFVSVARSSVETANRTPTHQRPRRQLQLSRPSGLRTSPPFRAWPAYPYSSPEVTMLTRGTQ